MSAQTFSSIKKIETLFEKICDYPIETDVFDCLNSSEMKKLKTYSSLCLSPIDGVVWCYVRPELLRAISIDFLFVSNVLCQGIIKYMLKEKILHPRDYDYRAISSKLEEYDILIRKGEHKGKLSDNVERLCYNHFLIKYDRDSPYFRLGLLLSYICQFRNAVPTHSSNYDPETSEMSDGKFFHCNLIKYYGSIGYRDTFYPKMYHKYRGKPFAFPNFFISFIEGGIPSVTTAYSETMRFCFQMMYKLYDLYSQKS